MIPVLYTYQLFMLNAEQIFSSIDTVEHQTFTYRQFHPNQSAYLATVRKCQTLNRQCESCLTPPASKPVSWLSGIQFGLNEIRLEYLGICYLMQIINTHTHTQILLIHSDILCLKHFFSECLFNTRNYNNILMCIRNIYAKQLIMY